MTRVFDRSIRREAIIGIAGLCVFAAALLLVFRSASAAAPTGTLTGTVQSITVGETAAINTLTFTDVSPAEVIAADDLRIRIPAGVNAVWDASDTTATIGGTASTSTSATVSYESDNKVLVIDATEHFSPLATLTIAGLSIIGVNYETAGAALEFSIDAGAAYGTANANTAITVTPAALTSTNVEPENLLVSRQGTATVSFTQTTSTPPNGKIAVTFPSGYSLASVGTSDGSCSTMDGTFTTAVSGQIVTITRSGGTIEPAGAQTCTIANVVNPSSTGEAGTYSIETQASSGASQTIESASATSDTFSGSGGGGGGSGGDTTPPGPATNVSVTSASDGASVTLTWQNPSDADLATVKVYRSTVRDALGDLIASTLSGSHTDATVTTGVTYYYLLRPVDSSGNEYVDATQYEVTPTAQPTPEPTPTPTPTPTPEPTPTPSPTPAAPTLPAGIAAGDLVRGSTSAVYQVSADGKRHVFPNEPIFLSWYPDFSSVKTVDGATLAVLPLGKNVTMRPGTYIVKIVSDPKVYAIEPGGVLRWIPSEEIARGLYGDAWAVRVRDIDVTLLGDHVMGGALAPAEVPAGSVLADGVGGYWWIVRDASGTMKRHANAGALAANRFPTSFTLASRADLPPSGADIAAYETSLAVPYP